MKLDSKSWNILRTQYPYKIKLVNEYDLNFSLKFLLSESKSLVIDLIDHLLNHSLR